MTLTYPDTGIERSGETGDTGSGLCRAIIVDNEVEERRAAAHEVSAGFYEPAAVFRHTAKGHQFQTQVGDWLLALAVSTILATTLSFLMIGYTAILSNY